MLHWLSNAIRKSLRPILIVLFSPIISFLFIHQQPTFNTTFTPSRSWRLDELRSAHQWCADTVKLFYSKIFHDPHTSPFSLYVAVVVTMRKQRENTRERIPDSGSHSEDSCFRIEGSERRSHQAMVNIVILVSYSRVFHACAMHAWLYAGIYVYDTSN